jgi:FtsZ-binding cell division protein ZapB
MSTEYSDHTIAQPHGDDDVEFGNTDPLDEVPIDRNRDDILLELRSQAQLVESSNQRTLPVNAEGFSEIVDAVTTLGAGVSCLYDKNVQLFTITVQLQAQLLELEKENDRKTKMLEECMQTVQAVHFHNHLLEMEVETLKETMRNGSNHTSTDGTFLWKISDVNEKIAAAMREQQTSIYSPPFYMSPTGYKMCMRLYPAGDEQARRTHLSVSLVIMRGEFDAVLPWPFTHKISFCLYDQTPVQRHVIDSFRPDPKSNSFQRPRSNMNIESGIPKFFPMNIIQQDNNSYVRDDSMLIRCTIHRFSKRNAVLPLLLSLFLVFGLLFINLYR